MYISGLLYVLIICFIAISTVGLIINVVSISYFIRNENRGLANKMMICLNLKDILSNLANRIYNSCYAGLPCIKIPFLAHTFYCALNAFAISSGCVTFAITLLRTIAIYRPFYHIRKRIFVGILVLVTVAILVLIGVLYLPTNYVPLQLCGVATVILSCFNIAMSAAAIIVLRKPEIEGVEYHRQERNYAVVTMVIISFIYFITSFPILLVLVVFPGLPLYQQTYAGEIYLMMLSLSSLLNPLVCIFRKQQIQTYIKECLRKLLYCCYRGC